MKIKLPDSIENVGQDSNKHIPGQVKTTKNSSEKELSKGMRKVIRKAPVPRFRQRPKQTTSQELVFAENVGYWTQYTPGGIKMVGLSIRSPTHPKGKRIPAKDGENRTGGNLTTWTYSGQPCQKRVEVVNSAECISPTPGARQYPEEELTTRRLKWIRCFSG